MKILHHFLYSVCGITVNALQQTKTNDHEYLLMVIIPMIAVIIFIVIIFIICYYVFRRESSGDVQSAEEERPFLEDHDDGISDGKRQSSSHYSVGEGPLENQNKRNLERKKLPSQNSKSYQSSDANLNDKPLINFVDTTEPNELNLAESYQSSDANLNDKPLMSFDEKTEPNLVGLQNESSECYMNCVLQSLASSEYFIKQLRSIHKELLESLLLKNTIKLIDDLNNTLGKANIKRNSNRLIKILDLIDWNKSSQQDAYEFLCSLINKIHNEMKIGGVQLELPLKIELLHKISGLPIPEKIQFHIGLSVGLCGNYKNAPGEKIEYLINEYFAVTNIDEDDTKTTQLFLHKQTPQVLLIHIQANKWNPELEKLVKPTYYIQYKEDLLINLPYHENGICKTKNVKYKLMAVIHHMGDLDNGHYVTYRKLKNIWLLANDMQVERKPFDENICPYILIYENDTK